MTTAPSQAIVGTLYEWNGHTIMATTTKRKFVVLSTTRSFRQAGQFVNLKDSNPVGPLQNLS